VLEKDISKIAY